MFQVFISGQTGDIKEVFPGGVDRLLHFLAGRPPPRGNSNRDIGVYPVGDASIRGSDKPGNVLNLGPVNIFGNKDTLGP